MLSTSLSALSGCRSQAPTASAPASIESTPDYATRLANWVQVHQPEPDAPNKWSEFADVAAQTRAVWDWFTRTNAPIAQFIAADPNRNYPAADPIALLDTPEYARFIPELRSFLTSFNSSDLAKRLDALADSSHFVAPRPVDALAVVELHELGHARLAGKLCMARARLAAASGDWDTFERSIRAAGALARGAQGRGLVMGGLVASAIVSLTDATVRNAILEGTLREARCAPMRAALAECVPPDLHTLVGGQRLATLEQIETYFDHQETERAPANSAADPRPLAPRSEQLALANRIFDNWWAALGDDPDDVQQCRRTVEEIYAQLAAHDGKRYEPLDTLLPAVGQIGGWDMRTRARHEAVLAMLSLEIYHAGAARYPDSLDALPGDEIPSDPYTRSARLQYRLIDAHNSDPAAAYLLYSVGLDAIDNGGTPPRPGLDATTTAGSGADLILNRRD